MDYLVEIKRIISTILKIDESSLPVEADMSDVENWDSMHHVMILAEIERFFDITIPVEHLFDLTSVKAFAEEVKKIKDV